jgi:hypothetical protein
VQVDADDPGPVGFETSTRGQSETASGAGYHDGAHGRTLAAGI